MKALFHLIAALTALSLVFSCKGKTEMPVEGTDSIADSTLIDSVGEDTLPDVVKEEPPKKADELFDDFAFSFMQNRNFQKRRINFPLVCETDGEVQKISEREWRYDRMYSQYEMYTLIFDNAKAEKAAKDTTLHRVIVEELDLDTGRAKSYDFRRNNGEWRLTRLTDAPMEHSENSEFYSFYHRFATDEDFQLAHIASPLKFSTFDDDEFKTVELNIEPEEFADYAPELPKSKITNILYGQTFKNSNLRILSLRALAGGMECQMVFKKTGGEWRLTRLDN